MQDEGFGESAFTGPGLQRAPSAPNLMDFGADTSTPPGSTSSASQLEPATESIPTRQHPYKGTRINEFFAHCIMCAHSFVALASGLRFSNHSVSTLRAAVPVCQVVHEACSFSDHQFPESMLHSSAAHSLTHELFRNSDSPGTSFARRAPMPILKGSPTKDSLHAGVGMDEFEQLMAASAQPNFLDDHKDVSLLKGDVDAMTPEPVMHSRHMNALGITPQRSLMSSFSAAARPGTELHAAMQRQAAVCCLDEHHDLIIIACRTAHLLFCSCFPVPDSRGLRNRRAPAEKRAGVLSCESQEHRSLLSRCA